MTRWSQLGWYLSMPTPALVGSPPHPTGGVQLLRRKTPTDHTWKARMETGTRTQHGLRPSQPCKRLGKAQPVPRHPRAVPHGRVTLSRAPRATSSSTIGRPGHGGPGPGCHSPAWHGRPLPGTCHLQSTLQQMPPWCPGAVREQHPPPHGQTGEQEGEPLHEGLVPQQQVKTAVPRGRGACAPSPLPRQPNAPHRDHTVRQNYSLARK